MPKEEQRSLIHQNRKKKARDPFTTKKNPCLSKTTSLDWALIRSSRCEVVVLLAEVLKLRWSVTNNCLQHRRNICLLSVFRNLTTPFLFQIYLNICVQYLTLNQYLKFIVFLCMDIKCVVAFRTMKFMLLFS
jgi:hypothetical protein